MTKKPIKIALFLLITVGGLFLVSFVFTLLPKELRRTPVPDEFWWAGPLVMLIPALWTACSIVAFFKLIYEDSSNG